MTKNESVSVNIPIPSSAAGLREGLQEIAKRRATSVSKIVAQVYSFAVSNQELFPDELDDPRPKPGKHISSEVPSAVSDQLLAWAQGLGRSRAHHCCFLLEVVLEDKNLQKKIFPGNSRVK